MIPMTSSSTLLRRRRYSPLQQRSVYNIVILLSSILLLLSLCSNHNQHSRFLVVAQEQEELYQLYQDQRQLQQPEQQQQQQQQQQQNNRTGNEDIFDHRNDTGTDAPSDLISDTESTLVPSDENTDESSDESTIDDSNNSSSSAPSDEGTDMTSSSTSMEDSSNASSTEIPSTLYPTVWNTRDTANDAYDTLPFDLKNKLHIVNKNERVIRGDYLIQLNTTNGNINQTTTIVNRIITEHGINIIDTYETVSIIKININAEMYGTGDNIDEKYISLLIKILNSTLVLFVEEDAIATLDQAVVNITDATNMTLLNTENKDQYNIDQVNPPSWGLDRIDQQILPLNNIYHADFSGINVTVYILDTGILSTHTEFSNGNRATCEYTIYPDEVCMDGNGHGTHVAGIIAGTTYGVAKQANVIGIKVFKNDGSGSHSGIIKGIDYIIQQHQLNPSRKIIINMSYGGSTSRAIDFAVQTMIEEYNILVIASAGNNNTDACNSSPGRLDNVLTVGSTDENDLRSFFSNYGACVKIFAPGSDIISSWYTSDTDTKVMSGTSMATPHVTGYAALYLEASTYYDDIANITSDPITFIERILADGTNESLSDIKDSPNTLLCTEALFQTLPSTFAQATSSSLSIKVTNFNAFITTTAAVTSLLMIPSMIMMVLL